ncbi:MAG: uroporphyrinogen-III synthase, partial [Chitinophagales bacterium]|nr:uroporphyrinogen-III synthase [Chitinophagales bacterium]
PAPAQGVLAFQCRENDTAIKNILKELHHPDVEETIAVERKILQLFHGGCHMPLGAYCRKENEQFHIWASRAADKISEQRRLYYPSPTTKDLAEQVFKKLNTKAHQTVFITRDIDEQAGYYKLLTAAGYTVSGKSLIYIAPIAIHNIPQADWIFFTSRNGVKYFFEQIKKLPEHIRIAAIGTETAIAVKNYGYLPHFIGNADTTDKFSFIARDQTVLFPQALYARESLTQSIEQYAEVIKMPVYENTALKNISLPQYDYVVFTSPMNADAYLSANNIKETQRIIAIGTTTKNHLMQKGFEKIYVPPLTNLMSVADLICGL